MREQKELLGLLQEIAAHSLTDLEKRLRGKLDSRELGLLDWLLLQYQYKAKGRWYDPFHILFSANFALDLIEKEGLDRLIVPGILLHDIGYWAVEDKSRWSSAENRILHMQEGTVLAARALCEHGYSPEELEITLGMIATHDNPYIGIEIHGRERLGLRDCDRVWVMHLLSYYKDFASKPERFQNPGDFLRDRITQFYGWEQPFGTDWSVTLDRIKKNAARIEVPTYSYTREYVSAQFESRIRELRQFETGTFDEFRHHLFAQIQNE